MENKLVKTGQMKSNASFACRRQPQQDPPRAFGLAQERSENVVYLRAAVKSVTAKDKRGRKNKRTDRSGFTALCLFTVRQAKLAISFSVPPKAQDMKATLFFCK